MLKRVALSLGLVEHTHKDPRRKNQQRKTKESPDFSLQEKDIFVRIVHAGGQQELYQHAILASKLMEKYPGMCVARPEVFRNPHQSVLWPEERLLPGQKYIIIPFRHVEKLKRKHSDEGKTREPNGVPQETLNAKITKSPNGHKVRENGKIKVANGVGQEMLDSGTSLSPGGRKIEENGKVKEVLYAKENQSLGGGSLEESFSFAKNFYMSKEKSTRYPKRRGLKGKKPFKPPLPQTRSHRGLAWQPGLPTVQELSP